MNKFRGGKDSNKNLELENPKLDRCEMQIENLYRNYFSRLPNPPPDSVENTVRYVFEGSRGKPERPSGITVLFRPVFSGSLACALILAALFYFSTASHADSDQLIDVLTSEAAMDDIFKMTSIDINGSLALKVPGADLRVLMERNIKKYVDITLARHFSFKIKKNRKTEGFRQEVKIITVVAGEYARIFEDTYVDGI